MITLEFNKIIYIVCGAITHHLNKVHVAFCLLSTVSVK